MRNLPGLEEQVRIRTETTITSLLLVAVLIHLVFNFATALPTKAALLALLPSAVACLVLIRAWKPSSARRTSLKFSDHGGFQSKILFCIGMSAVENQTRPPPMKSYLHKKLLAAACYLAAASTASAQTYSANFGDPGNTALDGSDLGAPSFTDSYAIANNVALYSLVVPTAETVDIKSTAFATGGADPYFSLFQGSGTSATFLASNYDQAFSTGGDFDYSAALAAGNYEIALGVSANESFAENYGAGTLADGFIGLGDPGSLGNGSYAIQVIMKSGQPVAAPEIDAATTVTAFTLLAGSLLVVTGRQRRPATCL